MSEQQGPVTIDELLAQRAWVSRMARSLARDEHAASDLEQEAWLAALLSRPKAVRGFFATVMRNRSSEGRRAGAARAARDPGRWSVGAVAQGESELLRSARDSLVLPIGVTTVDVRVLTFLEQSARGR